MKKYSDLLKTIKENSVQGKLLTGELIPTKVANYKNKLVLYKDGKVTYIEDYKTVYEYKFNPKTNPYLLLLFLAQNPTKTFTVTELDDKLNPQRSNANSTEERRVRDTVQEIRKKLKLNTNSDFLIVDRKEFGIRCSSEFK